MNPEEIRKTLATLTPTEKVLLMLFCEGLKQKEMAKKLGVTIKAIDFHFSNIYGKLGLEASSLPGKRIERWNIIREHYCEVLSEGIQTQPEEVEVRDIIESLEKTLVVKPSTELANPKPNYKTLALVREDFGELEEFKPGSGRGRSNSGNGRGCSIYSFLAGIVLAALVLVGLWFANQRFHFVPIALATQVSPTQTIEATSGNLEIAPEITHSPTTTPTVEAPTDTPTSTPTNIPIATQTGTPTPTVTPVILFFDDFSGDLSKWTQLGLQPYYPNNKAIIANEALTTSDFYGTWVVADIPAKTNYQIIINFKTTGCGGLGNFFSPAFIDNFHMIAFIVSGCGRTWGYTDGNSSVKNFAGTTAVSGGGDQNLVLTVKGKKLSAVLNKQDAGSVVNDMYEQGKIGIFVQTGDQIYDVMVVALP